MPGAIGKIAVRPLSQQIVLQQLRLAAENRLLPLQNCRMLDQFLKQLVLEQFVLIDRRAFLFPNMVKRGLQVMQVCATHGAGNMQIPVFQKEGFFPVVCSFDLRAFAMQDEAGGRIRVGGKAQG